MKMVRCTLFGMLILLGGCSSLQGEEFGVFDPYEETNRSSYNVTEVVDQAVVLPAAKAYDKVTPNWLQRGVLNVFLNLRTIGSSVNGFLQGKPASGGTDLARIVINSTLGVGGFFDLASGWGLRYQEEDFGQTLAVWGVTRSRYLYVPLLGPTTLRDLPSSIVRNGLPRLIIGAQYPWGLTGLDLLSARADLIAATKARDATALDPYAFTRDAYYQRRKFLIYDGDPPLDDLFDDFDD